jgi:NodT family efflux transporter outer membrane factor (OMF) lipoprotein
VESNTFGASLPVSYELDVWGRVRAGYFASQQDTLASRADVEAAAMTIAASVTERWFDVVQQRSLKQLLDRQKTVIETNLQLVQARFGEGDAALSEIYQQQQQLQSLQTQLVGVGGQETVAHQQLAALLGRMPSKLVSDTRVELPDIPPLPEKGIPASLLERRPDLRAAKARVVAADYRVAQAIAARLPQLTLSGSLGFNATELSEFFQSFVWSITGAINGTIWDGGRMDSEIARSKAVVDERLAAYGQALLTALVEVESALVLERQARESIALLNLQVETAQKTLDSARRRFGAGIGSYLAILTAETSLQQAQQQLLTTQRQLLSQRIQVYRALGSRWTGELKPPPRDDDEKKKVDEEQKKAS